MPTTTLGLHIIKNPAGTYSYVGNVPAVLCAIVPATKDDVMGGRAWESVDGELLTTKVKVFASREEAETAALMAGFPVK